MAKYFMGNTRLAELERMMMNPSRSNPTCATPKRKQPCSQTVRLRFSKREGKEGV